MFEFAGQAERKRVWHGKTTLDKGGSHAGWQCPVTFANQRGVTIRLAYCPPYHSKYNPVERTRGAFEQYWNGMLLTETQTTMRIAENMTWKGKHPIVTLVTQAYESGVKLTKKVEATYEKMINRMSGLEDWFVDISPAPG